MLSMFFEVLMSHQLFFWAQFVRVLSCPNPDDAGVSTDGVTFTFEDWLRASSARNSYIRQQATRKTLQKCETASTLLLYLVIVTTDREFMMRCARPSITS